MARPGKNTFLPDRFDEISRDSRYVGLHRRERSSWSMFAPMGIGLAAIVVLVLGGLWFVDRSDDYLELDLSGAVALQGQPPPEEPAVVEAEVPAEPQPITDPSEVDVRDVSITVLNGTQSAGLAARAGERLSSVGWPEPTATNAESSDVAQSVVAYSDDDDRGIALGIAQLLGIVEDQVVQTSAYPGVRITVVLGGDYVDTEST